MENVNDNSQVTFDIKRLWGTELLLSDVITYDELTTCQDCWTGSKEYGNELPITQMKAISIKKLGKKLAH